MKRSATASKATLSPGNIRFARKHAFVLCALLSGLWGCKGAQVQAEGVPDKANTASAITIALIGTSDLHGYLEPRKNQVVDQNGTTHAVEKGGLALLGGYITNVRKSKPVLLLDGGDLFQGTLVSNLQEGRAVIDGYNALGYTAAAVGNHEFDYGPAGPKPVATLEADDPNGALKARIAEARFPFLSANLVDKKTDLPVAWPNLYPSRLVHIAGVPIGLVGAITEDTPRTTNVLNLRDVRISNIIPAVRAAAEQLRRSGAAAVVLTIHEGANCRDFHDPRVLSACENEDGRVLPIARALHDVIDAVVAGHSHAGISHFVDGVPVIQAFAYGQAFARADLVFRRTQNGFVLDKEKTVVHKPKEVCSVQVPLPDTHPSAHPAEGEGDGKGNRGVPPQKTWECEPKFLTGKTLLPATYEGLPVTPQKEVETALSPHIQLAAHKRAMPLHVTLPHRLPRHFKAESPLGQFLADLTRGAAAHTTGESVDLALQNGGGIRNELPQGPLTYGALFEVLPFDNHLAIVRLPGQALVDLFKKNIEGGHGVLLPSDGFQVTSRCIGSELSVSVLGPNGQPIDPQRTYTVAVSDFLALGGDNFGHIVPRLGKGAVKVYEDTMLREIIVQELQRYDGPFVRGILPQKRLLLPMPRPVRCPPPSM